MSPVVIVVESLKLTVKPLAVVAMVLTLIALLPAGADAAEPSIASRATAAAPSAPAVRAASKPLPRPSHAAPAGASVRTVALDLGGLSVAAFGDNEEATR